MDIAKRTRFVIHAILRAYHGRSVRISLLPIALPVLLLTLGTADAGRAIPDDNLAYPVLIERPNGSGSGFYLNTGVSLYLVTAKHVLVDLSTGGLRANQVQLLSYPRDVKEKGRYVLDVNLGKLAVGGHVRWHQSADVAVVEIGSIQAGKDSAHPFAIALLEGVSMKEGGTSGLLGVGLDTIKRYEEVLTANEIVLFGYPSSLGIKQIPQLDPFRPLLRSGIVAGQNDASRSIIIDCPSYPGNSGGPVLEIEREALSNRFHIIGVVSQFVPFAETWLNTTHGYTNTSLTNSGYTVVVPMDSVLELVK